MRVRAAVLVLLIASLAARADVTTLTLPSNNFNITAGTVVTQTVSGVPAVNNLLGFSLSANWTAVSGDPWSGELLMGYTAPGGSPVAPTFYGGTDNGNPYTFPGSPLGINGFAIGTAPVNTPSGNYSFTFDHDFANSTANLANAAVTIYSNPAVASGNTAGAPTANRPIADGSGPSTIGTAVPYRTHEVTVSQSGRYMFVMSGFDTFLSLYSPAGYTPATPTANLIAANDDSLNLDVGVASVFTVELVAGSTYTLVATGYANTDSGEYTLYGAGSGTVTFNPVPEPATVLGAAAVALAGGWAVRRRRAAG
jgi:PEP-CTERM motif